MVKEQRTLGRIAKFLLGGSFLRRFGVYFCISLSVMLLAVWRSILALPERGYGFWLWFPAVAMLAMLAAVVSLIFASMRAATDLILRRLIAIGLAEPSRKDETG